MLSIYNQYKSHSFLITHRKINKSIILLINLVGENTWTGKKPILRALIVCLNKRVDILKIGRNYRFYLKKIQTKISHKKVPE